MLKLKQFLAAQTTASITIKYSVVKRFWLTNSAKNGRRKLTGLERRAAQPPQHSHPINRNPTTMDITREIYWNIGHGAALPMYLFAALTALIVIYGFARRIRVYRLGQPLARRDQFPLRLVRTLQNFFGQVRVMRVRLPGVTHALLFWGMLTLFIGTLLVMLQADFTQPLFDLVFLQGTFYKLFSLALDLGGLIALLTLFGFGVRRFLYRPKGLEIVPDDYLIHFGLAAILLTGFFIEGARMAATEMRTDPALAWFSPVGRLAALTMTGLDTAALTALHRWLWWLHFFLAMGLIAALPFTKLRHLFTAPAGTLFGDLRPKGAIATLDLEAEGVDRFGAEAVRDLTWKDIYDADACMACKRCQDRCPAWVTGKPLSPMRIVQQVGAAAFSRSPENLIEAVTPEALWACTACRACQEICPAEIEHVNKILEMRRALVLMRGAFPGPEVAAAVRQLEVSGNPFGLAPAARRDWASGLDIHPPGEADILYFVGCFASFDKRNQAVARSFVRVCQAAGVRVGILGGEETCCGEPLRKLGNEYLYQMKAAENIERMRASRAPRVVTTCPHCFYTLSRDYRDLGFDLEVEHAAVFLARLAEEGRLPLRPQAFEATYHDSCTLGRYCDILEPPRRLLRQAGGTIREMAQSGYEGFCCGAGGGRVLAEESLGSRINIARIQMAQATGAPLLVSNCPFCLTMFEDGIKTVCQPGEMRARDLVEVLEERLAAD
jgi:Fe-S oxidoreductase/nitrate reductase gamma subunit